MNTSSNLINEKIFFLFLLFFFILFLMCFKKLIEQISFESKNLSEFKVDSNNINQDTVDSNDINQDTVDSNDINCDTFSVNLDKIAAEADQRLKKANENINLIKKTIVEKNEIIFLIIESLKKSKIIILYSIKFIEISNKFIATFNKDKINICEKIIEVNQYINLAKEQIVIHTKDIATKKKFLKKLEKEILEANKKIEKLDKDIALNKKIISTINKVKIKS